MQSELENYLTDRRWTVGVALLALAISGCCSPRHNANFQAGSQANAAMVATDDRISVFQVPFQ